MGWPKSKPRPEETKKKITLGLKGKPKSEVHRKNMSLAHKGKPLSEEHRNNISLNHKGMEGKHHTEEARHNISLASKGKKHSEERKQKRSLAQKRLWGDTEYAKRQFKAQGVKPNKAELLLNDILEKNYHGEWKFVGDGAFWVNGKNPDFLNINGLKMVIELFGCYWHGCPICFPKYSDRNDLEERIEHYKKYGFNCLIIWEHELNDNRFVDKISKTLDRKYRLGGRL